MLGPCISLCISLELPPSREALDGHGSPLAELSRTPCWTLMSVCPGEGSCEKMGGLIPKGALSPIPAALLCCAVLCSTGTVSSQPPSAEEGQEQTGGGGLRVRSVPPLTPICSVTQLPCSLCDLLCQQQPLCVLGGRVWVRCVSRLICVPRLLKAVSPPVSRPQSQGPKSE